MAWIFNSCKSVSHMAHVTSGSSTGADDFLPLLIYTVLKAKPAMPFSNV